MIDRSHQTNIRFLSRVEFFRQLDSALLERLASQMTAITLKPEQALMVQGEQGEAMYVVVQGQLQAQLVNPDGSRVVVGDLDSGDIVGEMQLIVGGQRSATVVAKQPCSLLELSRPTFDRFVEEVPSLLDQLAALATNRLRLAQLASLLPKLLGEADDAFFRDLQERLEWVSLPRGSTLFRRGDPGDAWYVVTSGRLAVVAPDNEGVDQVTAEIGRGQGVGEMAILSQRSRTATVVAVRDTQLMKLPRDAFEELLPRWPRVVLSIARTLIDRLESSNARRPVISGGRHVAVIALDETIDLGAFCRQLTDSLGLIGPTLHLGSELLKDEGILAGGSSLPADHPQWTRFAAWFEERQLDFAHVVLEADRNFTAWSSRAVRECDQLLLVADAKQGPKLRDVESEHLEGLLAQLTGLPTSLVLMHEPSTILPRGTAAWLKARRVDAHHHLRLANDADFDRLARSLTGRAVGLALGGGGARGAAHFGVVRALREAGVPIDMVGGTSAGSIAAAMTAMGLGYDEMLERTARSMSIKPFSEFTFPLFSVVKGDRVDESAKIVFGDVAIEDLWIPYFAVSSNLTTAEMMVHDSGPVWFATRASGSLPGIVLPVAHGDDLLVDGGVIDNLPSLTLRERGSGVVVAVNVSPKEDMPRPKAGFPSPWRALSAKLFGTTRGTGEVPNILSILMRTSWLASAGRLNSVRRGVELFLEPPIEKWGMLEFEAAPDIAEAGYRYGSEELKRVGLGFLQVQAAGTKSKGLLPRQ